MLIEKLSRYYGMTVPEFLKLMNGDINKLYRFICDYLYNHN